MSTLILLALFCTILATTNSIAIREAPGIEDSIIPETNDERMQPKESDVVIREENATIPELRKSYCSHFDNTCVTCLKEDKCQMVRYTKQVIKSVGVEEDDFVYMCFDMDTTLEVIRDAYNTTSYKIIQAKSECPKISKKQLKSNVKMKSDVTFSVPPGTTEASTPPDETSEKLTSTDTNASTTTVATETTTTTQITTVTTATNATTDTPTTTQNTTMVTKSTTPNPTSATNSTQMPSTSKDPPPPASSGGWSFWSFFGGILLTLGLSAIGFVGFKYYKARSGQGVGGGLNYNRF